jgi:hypothetical protein
MDFFPKFDEKNGPKFFRPKRRFLKSGPGRAVVADLLCQLDLPVEEVALEEAVGLRVELVHGQRAVLVGKVAVALIRLDVSEWVAGFKKKF